jgi:hypothetical protein
VNVEEAVRQRILDLSTPAGSRVYMLKLPQRPTLPAVRVQLIDDPEEYHLRGGSTFGRARVQVDCYDAESSGADPYGSVNDLAAAVNGDDAGSGLSGWRGELGSPALTITGAFRVDRQALYEGEELRMVRMRLDFMVHYLT